MKQLRFTLENNEKTHPGLSIPAEREQQITELIAQAIVAVLQQSQGEENEPT